LTVGLAPRTDNGTSESRQVCHNAAMNVWPLVLVVVGLAGAVVTVRWSRLVWVRRNELPARVQSLAPVVAGSGLLGPLVAILGVIKTFGAVGGESVDPSQKARILAEDASGAAIWTASGIALWVTSAIALAWLLKQRRDPAG
jgi:hypothetical protein